MSDTKQKMPSANGPGAGFPGIKSGTEKNAAGSTRVEVGEPKGNQAKQMRDNDRAGEMHTDRFPLKGRNPAKDKFGDTKNTFHPKHGR